MADQCKRNRVGGGYDKGQTSCEEHGCEALEGDAHLPWKESARVAVVVVVEVSSALGKKVTIMDKKGRGRTMPHFVRSVSL
jgi:hypothetical protein